MWDWTAEWVQISATRGPNTEMATLQAPFRNVVGEGQLRRQLLKVLDELKIIISLVKKQIYVIRQFTQQNARLPNSGPHSQQHGERLVDPKWSAAETQGAKLLAKIEEQLAELQNLYQTAEIVMKNVSDKTSLGKYCDR